MILSKSNAFGFIAGTENVFDDSSHLIFKRDMYVNFVVITTRPAERKMLPLSFGEILYSFILHT